MNEIIELMVETSGVRLDKYVAEHTDLSRSHIQKLISEGLVLLDGKPAKPSYCVNSGESIHIEVPPPVELSLEPEDIPLDIIYEDENMMVIDKPAGLTVHPAPGHYSGTLVNAILAHCPDLTGIKGTVRPGIVHRLDKDTSGLIMVAKNDLAHLSLSSQIKKRTVQKWYLTLACGHVTPTESIIDAPIGRHPKDRKKMAIVSTGRQARSFYQVKRYIGNYSLLEVKLDTGRTHQIRVHLSSIGYPVFGDPVYGRKSGLLDRQFLHAARLGFTLPGSQTYVEFESELPPDLAGVLTKI